MLLSRRLDVFLVCAIASVLGNRVFLIITGYPQLGNGTLHISHAIWGALMMAIAIIFAVSFLPPATRGFVAFLGGAGFGWFIDELGKFITRDVNYFFKPTIALIYFVFIAMYLVFRAVERKDFGPDEAVLNGLEALKSAAIGQLDSVQRLAAVELIDRTEPEGPLAASVRALLADETGLPDPSPGVFARWGVAIRAWYLDLVPKKWFTRVVTWWFVFFAFATLISVVSLAFEDGAVKGFTDWATVTSSAVSAVLVMIGVVLLRRNRLAAYQWFERGVLVDIFVTQVFTFAKEQLGGVSGLVFNIVLWLALRAMIRAESERVPDPAPAVAAPVADPTPA